MMDNPVIFVVGPSRSGTSLLCNILGKHSQIVCMNELHMLGEVCDASALHQPVHEAAALGMVARLRARQLRTLWDDQPLPADMEFAKQIVRDQHLRTPAALFRCFAASVAKEKGKMMVAEQTPRNVMYLPQLLDAFPEAKVIAMIRDPRAVLNSQRSRWQMRFLGAPNVPLAESLRVFLNYHAITMSKLWTKAVEKAEHYAADPRVSRVRYEDLVSAPQATISGLCEFLGIEFEEMMMSVGRIGSSTHRNDDQKAGISDKSLDTWRQELPNGDREICEYLTCQVAARHGYTFEAKVPKSLSSILHMARLPLHMIGMIMANPRRLWIMAKTFLLGK